MSVSSKHPLHSELSASWETIRDCYAGEATIKLRGAKYLPVTPGQLLDGYSSGNELAVATYEAYKSRAVFPDFFELGVRTLIGILNAKPPMITLPKEMDFLRKRATLKNDTLEGVLRKIHMEQLTVGRAGVIADMPEVADAGKDDHYLEVYPGERILNWDDGSFNEGLGALNLVVLDESGVERTDDYSWKQVKKYRVLSLGKLSENEPLGLYTSGVSTDDEEINFVPPSFRGQTLSEIPFVFVNSTDIAPDPGTPPLLGLANLCLVIYRAEADYRNSLFLQGQDTLVVIGGVRGGTDEALRIGAGARIDLEINGDAKYVGIGPNGLPEQRTSLESDRALAAVRTGQLLAPGKMSMESGEALKTRVAAQTATLTSVAISAAAGLELILQKIAKWRGLNPDEVSVSPNLDFTNIAISGQDLVQLMTAKNLGAPISYETIHNTMRERGITRSSFEDEMKLIAADPKVLTDKAEQSGSLAGNNSLQAAGGATKKPEVKAPVSNASSK